MKERKTQTLLADLFPGRLTEKMHIEISVTGEKKLRVIIHIFYDTQTLPCALLYPAALPAGREPKTGDKEFM